MESGAASPPSGTTLTRALCLLVLFLMAGAAVYGAAIALRYLSRIGV